MEGQVSDNGEGGGVGAMVADGHEGWKARMTLLCHKRAFCSLKPLFR